MAYTKPNQTGYTLLQAGEYVVKIDTTPVAPVAVSTKAHVNHDTGNLVVDAYARVVNPDGSSYLDVNLQPIVSTFQSSMDRGGVAALGGIATFRKLMALTVLGEDVNNTALTPHWINALPVDVLAHASIRTNIDSAKDAASATDLSAIL